MIMHTKVNNVQLLIEAKLFDFASGSCHSINNCNGISLNNQRLHTA